MKNDKHSNRHSLAIIVVILLIIIVIGYISRSLIMRASFVKLSPTQPLIGQVSQTLINASGSNKILDPSGYALEDIHYFYGRAWAVAKFISPKGDGDNSTVVMQKVDQFYQVVLGPGTAFPTSSEAGLPIDVSKYLNSKGSSL